MTTENTIGIMAGVLTGMAALPQLVKVIRERDGRQLSPAMLLVLVSGLSCWVAYGVLREDWPVIITNAFSAFINTSILILRQVYLKK